MAKEKESKNVTVTNTSPRIFKFALPSNETMVIQPGKSCILPRATWEAMVKGNRAVEAYAKDGKINVK